VHINVQDGERVKAGDPLMDGPRNPHDILTVLGEKELQKYLVNEIQEVYRLQGVNINDKHLEVIVRQMMRWVKVEDIGDTEFLPEEVVDRFKFREENQRVLDAGGRPAQGKPCCSASPRRRCPPTRSSPPHPSRRPRACSPKPPSTARWTTCGA
jgi:DNA-directed RNA polymerase subunit beta'